MNNEFLTNIVNFDIGSAFSKGLGSAFSEVSSPDPGPLSEARHFFPYMFF